MAEINYENLVKELVKPLVSRPEEVIVKVETINDREISVEVLVDPIDLGRVIGKHERVASAIRTLAHAAATRNDQSVTIEFTGLE